jgi:hypothetical protein
VKVQAPNALLAQILVYDSSAGAMLSGVGGSSFTVSEGTGTSIVPVVCRFLERLAHPPVIARARRHRRQPGPIYVGTDEGVIYGVTFPLP